MLLVAVQEPRRLVAELEALDVPVESCVELRRAALLHDARDYEVVAFTRASLGPIAEEQKQAFRAQHADVRFVEVIGPLAVRQIVAALEHAPGRARFVRDLDVEPRGTHAVVRVEVLVRTQLKLWLFRQTHGALTTETLALVDAAPGIFSTVVPGDAMASAVSVVVEANGDELLHFPCLESAARA